MYRIFQFFVLALKIDVFIEFLVSLFYFIQFAIEDFTRWDGYIILIVTILILPALYFARATVRSNIDLNRVSLFLCNIAFRWRLNIMEGWLYLLFSNLLSLYLWFSCFGVLHQQDGGHGLYLVSLWHAYLARSIQANVIQLNFLVVLGIVFALVSHLSYAITRTYRWSFL